MFSKTPHEERIFIILKLPVNVALSSKPLFFFFFFSSSSSSSQTDLDDDFSVFNYHSATLFHFYFFQRVSFWNEKKKTRIAGIYYIFKWFIIFLAFRCAQKSFFFCFKTEGMFDTMWEAKDYEYFLLVGFILPFYLFFILNGKKC